MEEKRERERCRGCGRESSTARLLLPDFRGIYGALSENFDLSVVARSMMYMEKCLVVVYRGCIVVHY